MKTAIAVRHVHFEDLGTLEPLLRQRDYRISYCDAGTENSHRTDIEAADLLVVLGAPIGAFDDSTYPFLSQELKWIEQRLRAERPLLGICLGAQLMARAKGANVAQMNQKEIGFSPIELTTAGRASALGALPPGTAVLHWHGDQFEIPRGSESLARTDICPHQAFAAGKHALGLQFHLEADADRIEPWLIGHASELSQAGVDPRLLREQAKQHGAQLKAAAQGIFSRWLDQFE